MCGEHRVGVSDLVPVEGSSPHVRGALSLEMAFIVSGGIIPACAGSTHRRGCLSRTSWDHPRMCGEHADKVDQQVVDTGSSPHVRGARNDPSRPRPERGIIPACAGSTEHGEPVWMHYGDHPRMCGEHFHGGVGQNAFMGSSPHVRGAQPGEVFGNADVRDHPRMCGEHLVLSLFDVPPVGSSPHVRGALKQRRGG